MKIRRDIFSFRNRVVVIIVGVSLGMVSLLYTNNMAKRLKEKEQHDVALWAHAMERVEPQRDGRLDGRPAHHRHRVERQQHPVHHDQREPGGTPIPPGSRKDHRPPRPAAQADRQIHGREHPAHGAFLVVRTTTTTSSSTGDRHCSNRSTTSPMSRYWS